MKKRVLFLLLGLFFIQLCRGQYYSTGEDRGSITWREIYTKEFQLVYPDYFEREAQRMANLLSSLYKCNKQSMSIEPKRVSILLHTEAAKSNGYVAWAPKRSELYTTPPNSGVPNDWLEHLATHEYRHVVQMDKLHESLPRLLSYIFGEQIVPFVLSYKVPLWFMEGDAVLTETLLSNTGRGRSPEFLQVMKAYLVEREDWYGYDKAVLGSYKDFVPSAYELGYAVVANSCKNYGRDIWVDALHNAGKHPFPWRNLLHYSFEDKRREKVFAAILKNLGGEEAETTNFSSKLLNFKERWSKNKHRNKTITLYNDNMAELQFLWKHEADLQDTTKYRVLSAEKNLYTNYYSPQILDDGSVVAHKTGYEDYGSIVRIKEGKEERLFVSGHLLGKIQSAGKLLYWTEYVPDLRWAEKSKSVIYCLNIDSFKKNKVPAEQSLYMPSANEDNSLLVAVVKNNEYTNELVVVNRITGEIQFRQNMGSVRITDPLFLSDDKIAYIFTQKGTGIGTIDLTNKAQEVLLAPRNVPLADLEYAEGKLYFTGGYASKNDIYSYNLSTDKLQKWTASSYGATQASVSGKNLVYCNYTAGGYEVAKMSIDNTVGKEVKPNDWKDDSILKAIVKEESCAGEMQPKEEVFSSQHYKKGRHLFNFHSHSPFMAASLEVGDSDLGISASSQNLLSTMFANVGYRNKDSYKNGQFYANLAYKGIYPVITTELSYGKQSHNLLALLKKSSIIDTATIKESRNRMEWKTEMRLPFNISRGKYTRGFSVGAGIEFTRDMNVSHSYLRGTNSFYEKGDALKLDVEKTHQLLKYHISFSNMHKKSYRDLMSPFGQQLYFTYRHTPFDRNSAYTYALKGLIYLPSVFKHHGVRMYGGYQYWSRFNTFLKDDIQHPRGSVALWGDKMYAFMFDYKFPLAYPDWNLGRALYVKRLKTSFFYDYGLTKKQNFSKDVHSYGLELTADAHVIQIPVPIVFGVRVGYETQSASSFCNALLSISF